MALTNSRQSTMASSASATSILPTLTSLHRHPLQPPPPHVLLVAYPAQGHNIALFSLAKLLASKGVAVTYVCVQHRISRLQHAAAGDLDPLIRLVGLPERVPVGEVGIDEGTGIEPWLREVAIEMENDFVQLLHELPRAVAAAGVGSEQSLGAPICIIYDSFLWWALDVAVSLKIKHYAFFVFPAYVLSIMLHIPLFISKGYVPLRLSAEPRLITLPGLAPAWDRELLYFISESSPKDSAQWLIDFSLKLNESPTILINTCYELEASTIDALQNYETMHQTKIKVQPLGPVLPPKLLDENYVDLYLQGDGIKEEEKECLRWLDSRSPASVLYVSFGSIFIPSLENITELALGLEASNHAFLWVLRPPPCDGASRDQSFPLSSLLPEGFESRTKDRGFIISPWAPQLLILSHPSTGGFLTHCGWNSTIESIYMGVPFIAYPRFAEQNINCRIIVDQLHVGVQLTSYNNETLHKEEVEKAVRILMGEEGKQMKKNVRQLRDITRKSLKEGGSSHTNLHAFVQELFQLSDTGG